MLYWSMFGVFVVLSILFGMLSDFKFKDKKKIKLGIIINIIIPIIMLSLYFFAPITISAFNLVNIIAFQLVYRIGIYVGLTIKLSLTLQTDLENLVKKLVNES